MGDDFQGLLSRVAAAVSLDEGAAGVRVVLRELQRQQPTPARDVSRAARLPVPLGSAVCNELRWAGVVSPQRPLQLTPAGRDTIAAHLSLDTSSICPACGGRGIDLPDDLRPVLDRLE